ncbi:MAG: right-handed parallel beta-helix repeat-containing protein [Thermoanaerobaculia bacterium]|nr:right-handed parallel beta-helix repeat-containing protein [Thermoanaerobaculia bacterium]
MSPIRAALLLACLALPVEAATFKVISTAHSGPGSLRQAIADAQTAGGSGHRVEFAIPGPGPHVINLWPGGIFFSGGIEIDGYTQPGSRPNTSPTGFNADLRIVLDGTPVFPNPDNGLTIYGDATIRGLALRTFFSAIRVDFSRATVTGCSFENSEIAVEVRGGQGSRIGGPTPAERNWFRHSWWEVVRLDSALSPIVEGNLIGTDASGFAAGRTYRGVVAIGGQAIVVRDNVLSGSMVGPALPGFGQGILFSSVGIDDPSAPPSIIEGNRIGVGADGVTPVPNAGDGIQLDGSENVEVRGNLIRFNEGNGIRVTGNLPPGRRGITILGNSIADNLGIGIDLEGALGVDGNDDGDLDDGPNDLQNFPVLLGRSLTATGGSVRGSVRGLPGVPLQIELFASDACSLAGHGEGQEWIAATTVTTDAGGLVEFEIPVTADHRGRVLTATATSERGTSEFSACLGPTGPLEVPTASTWGLALLATLLMTVGMGRLRRV